MYSKKEQLNDNERILLSRIYKLDRQIGAYMQHHNNMSMNRMLPSTDFIKKAHLLYNDMNLKLIKISLKETKYTQNLVDMKKIISSK